MTTPTLKIFENIVGTGENASYQHFFPNLFSNPIINKCHHLTLSQTTNFRLLQTERVCRRQFPNFTKMAENYPNRKKTLWEKDKLLITSNFSFSHSVFKRLVLQTRKNQGLFGKGLSQILISDNVLYLD